MSRNDWSVLHWNWWSHGTGISGRNTLEYANGQHFVIDMVTAQVPRRFQPFFRGLSLTLMLIVAFLFLIVGAEFAGMGLRRVSPTMDIPMIVIWAAIPIGGLLMLLYLLEAIHEFAFVHHFREPADDVERRP